MEQNNMTPPPPNTPHQSTHYKKKKTKPFLIIGIIAVAVIAWVILAHFFGPTSEYGIAKRIESLQKDSIMLQQDHKPQGHYTRIEDVYTDVSKIKDLGNPLRYGSSEVDSMQLYSNSRTAAIAKYNIAKCDSVLEEVLPLWRIQAMMALTKMLKAENPNTIVQNNTDYEKNTGLNIYSIRYLSPEELEKDADKYNFYLANLGYRYVLYAGTPEMPGKAYTFKGKDK